MDIVESRAGRTSVLALTGALDASSAPALSVRALGLCDNDNRAILIDLAQVRYLTSAAFRSFIAIRKRAEPAGVVMALCGLNELTQDLFTASGLQNRFRIYPDQASALAAIDQLDTP
jgi:anti-anti-sigma factor